MAAPLDDLYGTGAQAELLAALDAESTEVVETPEGVKVYVTWPDEGSMKIVCSADNVHYASLHVPPRSGRYTTLCERLPGLFKARGVKTFTASAGDEASADVLRRRGAWTGPNSALVWRL